MCIYAVFPEELIAHNMLYSSWSRYSRYVLTSSKDWNVIVWDLLSDSDPVQRYSTIRFDAPVIFASFHPRNRYQTPLNERDIRTHVLYSRIMLALLSTGEAYLVDLRKENRGQVELCEVQDESEDEGEVQMSKARCVSYHIISQYMNGELTIAFDVGPQ